MKLYSEKFLNFSKIGKPEPVNCNKITGTIPPDCFCEAKICETFAEFFFSEYYVDDTFEECTNFTSNVVQQLPEIKKNFLGPSLKETGCCVEMEIHFSQ